MVDLVDKALTYFKTFSNKDSEGLRSLFSENVYLRDWEILANGIDEVVEVNQNIFDFMDRAREDRYLPFWMSEGAEKAAKYSSYAPIPTNEMRRFYNFLENQPISQY